MQNVIINGKKEKRKKAGVYPKWRFISSHTLRRTAATHYYQMFGTRVKNLTGHKKDSTVMTYVRQDTHRQLSQNIEMRNEYNENTTKIKHP